MAEELIGKISRSYILIKGRDANNYLKLYYLHSMKAQTFDNSVGLYICDIKVTERDAQPLPWSCTRVGDWGCLTL